LIERRWRCVQHYLFSCKASPCVCPDLTDLWADLWHLLSHESSARKRVRLALHLDSFDADSVFAHCMPWLLDPFSFLQGCFRSRRDAVCSVIVAFVLLVGAPVADDAVPAGSCVFASGLVRRSLSAPRCRLRLVLLGVAPFRSAPLGVLRPKPRWVRAWSPTCVFFCRALASLHVEEDTCNS
jgi:hypothetical protein